MLVNRMLMVLMVLMLLVIAPFHANSQDARNEGQRVHDEKLVVSDQITTTKDAKIILSTIERLVDDGLLSEENAQRARQAYVVHANDMSPGALSLLLRKDTEVSESEFFSFAGAVKVFAVILLLVAFSGVILNIAGGAYALFALIPPIILQVVGLFFSMSLTLLPDTFYVVLLGSILNLLILFWFSTTSENFFNKLIQIIGLGLPPFVTLGLYISVYFGFLTMQYQSSIFGLLAVSSLVFSTGFVVNKFLGGIAAGVEEKKYLRSVIGANFIMLLAYGLVTVTNYEMENLQYFAVGIEHACALALGVCLLIAAAPWRKGEKGFFLFVALMLISFSLAFVGSSFYGLHTISVYLNTVFMLWLMEWVGFYGYRAGFIFFSILSGVVLYSAAMLLERYPEYFVSRLL